MTDSANNDNVRLNLGTGGALVATDMVSVNGLTSHAQYVKLAFGGSGNFYIIGDGTDTGHAGGQSTQQLPVKIFSTNNRAFSATTWTGTSDALDVYLRGAGITIDANLSHQYSNFIAVAGSCSGTTPISVAGDSGGAPVAIRVGVSGSANTMFVQGTAGGAPVGVCATDLDIRGITINWDAPSQTGTGDVLGVYLMQGLSSGASGAGGTAVVDSVAVQGISGGYPVLSALRGTTGLAGFAGVGVHGTGLTGAELLVRIASQGLTIGVDGHFNRVLGGGLTSLTVAKTDLPHGFSGTYGGTYDHVGIQGISNGLPVRTQAGHYTNAGFTSQGFSGNAALVSLAEGINLTANVSATTMKIQNLDDIGTQQQYLRVAGTTSGEGFVPIAGNTAGTQGISIAAGAQVQWQTTGNPFGITTTANGTDFPLNIRGLTANMGAGGTFDAGSDVVGITGQVAVRALVGTYNNAGTYSGDVVGVTGEVVSRVNFGGAAGLTVMVAGFTSGTFQVGIRQLQNNAGGTGDIVGISGDVNVTATDLDIRGLSFGIAGFTGATAGTVDHTIVQGISGAYPISAILGHITADGNVEYFGKSGDALKVSLSDGVSVTANISGSDFNLAGIASDVGADNIGMPVWVYGQTGADSANTYDTLEVTGIKGTPIVVGGTSGTWNHPVLVAGPSNGITIDMNDSNANGFSGAFREIKDKLDILFTVLGNTAGDGPDPDNGGAPLSIFKAMPTDAATNGNMLPSYKQVSDLVNAFQSTDSGGENFIEVLENIADFIGGPAGGNNIPMQGMMTDDSTGVRAKVGLEAWSSPEAVISGSTPLSPNTTAIAISGSNAVCGSVRVKAHPNNSDFVYVFSSAVIAGNMETSGFPLSPGEDMFIEVDNLNKIFAATPTGSTNRICFFASARS